MPRRLHVDEPAYSPEYAVRKSVPLFKKDHELLEIRWVHKGAPFLWVIVTPNETGHLAGSTGDPDVRYCYDFQFARGSDPDELPLAKEFTAATWSWVYDRRHSSAPPTSVRRRA